MAKYFVILITFVFLIMNVDGRNVPGAGGRRQEKYRTLERAAAPVAEPPSRGGVDDQKNIFGGVGAFAGMGGYIGGLFPHLGGVGVIGKYGGIGGGFGVGHGGFGGGVGGVGGIGGGLVPFP
ncbi:glycine-rich protein 5-like isoform X3 [Cucumis sativus]|uniref:glycine-rich protein 5-like isoform X3 n=1 Tax=Cucumis sativus TaxID=3659 RepID=UPI0012F4DB98|nr:glycine-rich protein 5-like isoform X3 [Cucumis sativus]